MREANGMSEIGDVGLAQLGVRNSGILGKNVDNTVPGYFNKWVQPGFLKGMSVTPWFVPLGNYGAKQGKPLWRLNILVLPFFNLSFFQDASNHGVIIPSSPMSLGAFRQNVHKTTPHWEKYQEVK